MNVSALSSSGRSPPPCSRSPSCSGGARLFLALRLGAAAGRFPDDPGHDAAAGRQSRHDGAARHRAAGAPARADPLAADDDLVIVLRPLGGDAAVRPQPRHRRRRAGRAGGDQRRRLDPAEEPALPARLLQGEPGRHRRHHRGPDLQDDLHPPDVGSRRYADRPAAQPARRRRPRRDPGRPEARRSHPGRPIAPRRLRDRHGGSAQRRSPTPTSRAPRVRSTAPAILCDRRQRPAGSGRRLQAGGHHLPQRRARPHRRRGGRGGRPGERPRRRLVSGHARDHRRRAAPARRQRGADGRQHQGRAHQAEDVPAGRRRADVVSDRTGTIRASIADVQFTLLLSVALVVLVVLVFLRSCARRSSPASPCRCRSWRPLARCTISASASTTCR